MKERPKIGIATIVKKDDLILIGRRINSHGNKTWAFPGGHLEKYESFIDCASRETKEETGLIEGIDIKYTSLNPIAITNDLFKEDNKHYITLFMEAQQISNKFPKIMEPNKCEKWTYMPWEKILKEKQIFLPIYNLIKQGFNPYQIK